MKVLELLDEIEEIVDTSTGFPLTGKIMVDAEEILEIVKEIRVELPEEIQQAQWVNEERHKIIEKAKKEYESVLLDAQRQAEILIENDDIVVKAKMRAEEIMRVAEDKVKELKLGTFNYIDNILFEFQNKMDEMNAVYFGDMYNNLGNTFGKINEILAENRDEMKEMAYHTQMDDAER